jgi:hypothetical protein
MISFCITLILTMLSVSTLWIVQRLVIPLIAQKIEDRQWKKLHPDMPLDRRPFA